MQCGTSANRPRVCGNGHVVCTTRNVGLLSAARIRSWSGSCLAYSTDWAVCIGRATRVSLASWRCLQSAAMVLADFVLPADARCRDPRELRLDAPRLRRREQPASVERPTRRRGQRDVWQAPRGGVHTTCREPVRGCSTIPRTKAAQMAVRPEPWVAT